MTERERVLSEAQEEYARRFKERIERALETLQIVLVEAARDPRPGSSAWLITATARERVLATAADLGRFLAESANKSPAGEALAGGGQPGTGAKDLGDTA